MSGWIKRPKGTVGLPAGLVGSDAIVVKLANDPGVYYDWRAGEVDWHDGPGEILEYRVPSMAGVGDVAGTAPKKHRHYFRNVSHLSEIDVYRVLSLFGVTDQALGHAIKKLLVAGGRGAGKDIGQDVQEAVDTLLRWQEMRGEDSAPLHA